MLLKLKTIIFFSFLFFPLGVSAHQFEVISSDFTIIEDPMIAQAFYGNLNGVTSTFQIAMEEDFNLYIGLLVPDIKEPDKNIFAKIYFQNKEGEREEIVFLDGIESKWRKFYKKLGGKNYLWGPELASQNSNDLDTEGVNMIAGDYTIEVYGKENTEKFVLIVGDEKIFDTKAILRNSKILQRPKEDFFGLFILKKFFGQTLVYLLVPLGIIFLFLFTAIAIAIKQVRDRMKHLEG